MRHVALVLAGTALPICTVHAQTPAALSAAVREYVSVDAPVVALSHVRVIDGTGAPPAEDQTVVIANGRIQAVGAAATVSLPAGARVMDLAGYTVIPGLVGTHNHTFYYTAVSQRGIQSNYSAPRLYLGSGVTTIRTTGSAAPYAELNLRASVERGETPGPRMHITGPYVIGPGPDPRLELLGARRTATPEEARRAVAYWAEEGATWIKAYNTISRAQLAAVIDEAHKHGIKVTAHLCSVGFREAAGLGIDHLEHSLYANSEYHPDKEPDACPPGNSDVIARLDIASPAVQQTFSELTARKVGMSSTLAVYECVVPGRPTWDPRVVELFTPEIRQEDSTRQAQVTATPATSNRLAVQKKVMDYELAFVKAGGLLTAGVDPAWCAPAGFGDQRNFELLVEAGFTPVQVVQIMTANGAKMLGVLDQLGTVTVGKLADLVVIQGNPAANPTDIRKVTTVFKGGVGYDSAKLIAAVKGQVGLR